jgi:hypothetical protein
MPPVPRHQIAAEFRKAVYADARGVVRLSALAGFPVYTAMSRLFRKGRRFSATAANLDRLRKLAEVVGYTGEVSRG